MLQLEITQKVLGSLLCHSIATTNTGLVSCSRSAAKNLNREFTGLVNIGLGMEPVLHAREKGKGFLWFIVPMLTEAKEASSSSRKQ